VGRVDAPLAVIVTSCRSRRPSRRIKATSRRPTTRVHARLRREPVDVDATRLRVPGAAGASGRASTEALPVGYTSVCCSRRGSGGAARRVRRMRAGRGAQSGSARPPRADDLRLVVHGPEDLAWTGALRARSRKSRRGVRCRQRVAWIAGDAYRRPWRFELPRR
jgi:hypothetical protein